MKSITFLMLPIMAIMAIVFSGCNSSNDAGMTKSNSGVFQAKAEVKVQSNGLTFEQANVKKRAEFENKPGSIKHLYIISPYTGQTLLYSTIKGKVTSSGKRLTPKTVLAANGNASESRKGISVKIGDTHHRTSEVLGDDGTYGSSIPYIYWWDVNNRYHQHYIMGGQIIHLSNKPIAVKSITINMEIMQSNEDDDAKYKKEEKRLVKQKVK